MLAVHLDQVEDLQMAHQAASEAQRRAARAAEAKETEPPLALALGADGLPFAIVAALRASVALALHCGVAAAPLHNRANAPSGLGTIIALRAAAPTGERRGGSV